MENIFLKLFEKLFTNLRISRTKNNLISMIIIIIIIIFEIFYCDVIFIQMTRTHFTAIHLENKYTIQYIYIIFGNSSTILQNIQINKFSMEKLYSIVRFITCLRLCNIAQIKHLVIDV